MIDLHSVQDWIKEAGDIALQYYQKVEPKRKADNTLVTEADTAIESFLVDKIQSMYPDHEILAEEGARVSGKEYSWVIDPVDGTLAFVWGVPTWCISVGVLRNMQPYFGIVYMPLTRELYSAYHHGKAIWNRLQIRISDNLRVDEDSVLCISPRTLQEYTISFPGNVCSLGSGIMHHCLVARGVAIGSLTLQPSIWDLAGVYPVLRAAGASLRYLSGKPVELAELHEGHPVAQPILTGHPEVIKKLLNMISRKEL
jgi:myo-inositol-1(or 4)-monophosphatase